MLIDRTTANTLIKQSLVVLDLKGKVCKDVKTFDTSNMEIVFGDLSTDTGSEFYFVVANDADKNDLEGQIDTSIHFSIIVNENGPPKRSLDETDTAEFLSVISKIESTICQCSNCDTNFLVHVDSQRNVWVMDKPNASDTFFTMTKVTGSLNCDNCGSAITVLFP